MKAKGTEGSIAGLYEITLNNCELTAPSGATKKGGSVMQNGSVCTEQVVITSTASGIARATADVPAKKQGTYNLQGVRMADGMGRLPAGVYVVGGKKVVKK